ncbi:MAG: alpha/beta fold hydrolase [Alphaproteobacteria bacterium]|nr:alpha/beta fold hydrolase [Alphaproteobacteria bacterium]
MSTTAPVSKKPVMAVHTEGSGPPLIMLHGGFGCWRHWVRNVGPLSEHFTVHAFDLPCYGESAPVPKELPGDEYLDIVYREIGRRFPGPEKLRFAGFSFGGAISTYLSGRLGDRVSHLALISPGGFPPRKGGFRNMMSYKAARGNEELMQKTVRHNLLQHMLFYYESLDEQAIEIQRYCVDHTTYDSRKVSRGGGLAENLEKITCKLMLLWGEKDDFDFRPADESIAQIRAVIPEVEVHRIPKAGHWSAYENAPEVNRRLIDFLTRDG